MSRSGQTVKGARFPVLALLGMLLVPGSEAGRVQAATGEPRLQIGQPAPAFELPDDTGTVHRLADYRGRTVVLMFYPKDFTPG